MLGFLSLRPRLDPLLLQSTNRKVVEHSLQLQEKLVTFLVWPSLLAGDMGSQEMITYPPLRWSLLRNSNEVTEQSAPKAQEQYYIKPLAYDILEGEHCYINGTLRSTIPITTNPRKKKKIYIIATASRNVALI